jgi:hypothetical protein
VAPETPGPEAIKAADAIALANALEKPLLSAAVPPGGAAPAFAPAPAPAFAHLPSSASGTSTSLSAALRTLNLYLSAFIFFCIAGSGLVTINNVASIVKAYRPDSDASAGAAATADLHVILAGLGNFLGRMLIGLFSDRLLARGVARPKFLVVNAALMSAAYFALSFSLPTAALYPLVFVIGWSFGGTFAVCTSIAADLFGAQHHGAVYGALELGPACGAVFFATLIVNTFYVEGRNAPTATNHNCFGYECFQYTFVTCCAATALAALAALVLVKRTQFIYQGISRKHSAAEQDDEETEAAAEDADREAAPVR